MATIIPPGYAEVALPMQHELLARTAYITYGIAVDLGEYTATEAADAQPYYFELAWGDELDSQVTVGPATLRVGQDGGEPLVVAGSGTFVGAETAAMPPPSVSLLVKKGTNLGGRRGRGRCYIPWVTQEAAINDVGNLDGASLTVRQSDANDWLTNLSTGPSGQPPTPMYLLHDSEGSGVEPPPTPVVSLSVSQLVANQRRRLGR